MKKVTINGFDLFCKSDLSLIELAEWVGVELNNPFNVFNLNESHSCIVSIDEEVITISGDEDLCEIDIESITLLDFSGKIDNLG